MSTLKVRIVLEKSNSLRSKTYLSKDGTLGMRALRRLYTFVLNNVGLSNRHNLGSSPDPLLYASCIDRQGDKPNAKMHMAERLEGFLPGIVQGVSAGRGDHPANRLTNMGWRCKNFHSSGV